jgi:single-strand DNA-binding protein
VRDTIVTVVGNVVDSPRRVSLDKGAVTNFRMASTARRYDARTEQFVDAGTFWVDVECWNTLSGNVSASVSKGDPVIVHGALTTHSWESDNGPRSKPRIKAFAVGPDLTKGRSVFSRDRAARRPDPADAEVDAGAVDAGEAAPEEEAFTDEYGDLQPGRDYEVSTGALGEVDDLPREPAHA